MQTYIAGVFYQETPQEDGSTLVDVTLPLRAFKKGEPNLTETDEDFLDKLYLYTLTQTGMDEQLYALQPKVYFLPKALNECTEELLQGMFPVYDQQPYQIVQVQAGGVEVEESEYNIQLTVRNVMVGKSTKVFEDNGKPNLQGLYTVVQGNEDNFFVGVNYNFITTDFLNFQGVGVGIIELPADNGHNGLTRKATPKERDLIAHHMSSEEYDLLPIVEQIHACHNYKKLLEKYETEAGKEK